MSTPDMLEVINGPEDGTEFPMGRAPVIVGSDLDCAVNVRLDESVQRYHARLTAVGDGYRVRKIRGGTLAVDGRRAGVVRSRILREGGILRVGDTEFYLRCAPDGLAKRSRGLPTENDLVWTIRILLGTVWRALSWILNLSGRGSRFWRILLLVFTAGLVAGYVQPGMLARIRYILFGYWLEIQNEIMTLIDSALS